MPVYGFCLATEVFPGSGQWSSLGGPASVLLPERSGSYCLGSSAVLCNFMSPVGLESKCWLAQSGQRALCGASLRVYLIPLSINV